MPRVLASLLLFVGACSVSPSRSITADDIPEDTVLVAIVLEDAQGFLFSTPFGPASDTIRIPDEFSAAKTVRLVGLSQAQIDALALKPGASLEGDRPRPPEGFERHFDDFVLSQRGTIIDGDAKLVPAAPRSLTSDSLANCPVVFEEPVERIASTGCADGCMASFRQLGCDVLADLEGCGARGTFRWTIDPNGVIFDEPTNTGCRTVTPSFDASFSIECTSDDPTTCRVDAIRDVAFETVSVSFDMNTASRLAGSTSTDGTVYGISGLLTGMAIRADDVVVSAFPPDSPYNHACPADDPTKTFGAFHFVDQASVEVRQSLGVGSCFVRLASDPDGSHFWATGTIVDAGNNTLYLGVARFTETSTFVAAPYAPPTPLTDGVPYGLSLLVDDVVTLLTVAPYDATPRGWVTTFDPDDFATPAAPIIAPTAESDLLGAPTDLVRDRDGIGYVIVRNVSEVWRMSATGALVTKIADHRTCGTTARFTRVTVVPDGYLVSSVDVGQLFYVRNGSCTGHSTPGGGDPYAVVRYTDDYYLVSIANMAVGADKSGRYALFDLVNRTFRPWSQASGFVGPAEKIERDAADRFWAIYPVAGALARFTVR